MYTYNTATKSVMQDEYTQGQAYSVMRALHDYYDECPNEIRGHVAGIYNQCMKVVQELTPKTANFYKPISRSELALYKQRLDNEADGSFRTIRDYVKEIKQAGHDTTGLKEMTDRFIEVMKNYFKLVQKDAASRLPQHS